MGWTLAGQEALVLGGEISIYSTAVMAEMKAEGDKTLLLICSYVVKENFMSK